MSDKQEGDWSSNFEAMRKSCQNKGFANPFFNPYRINKRTGQDHFSTLAWRLTVWKMENVFPIDLRARVPVVALLTAFNVKSKLSSVQGNQQDIRGHPYLLSQFFPAGS